MRRQMDEEQLDREVLYLLGKCVGKERAIDRWQMVYEIFGEHVPFQEQNDRHLLDRAIRYSVNRLRGLGHLICDLGDGHGRYLAANEQEFWELYSYYAKPIKERARILQALKQSAAQKFPNLLQPPLFDLDALGISELEPMRMR